MSNIKFNITKCLLNKNVTGEKSLQEIIDYLRNPTDEIRATVDSARAVYPFGGNKNSIYTSIKNSLPCFIPNFIHKGGYVNAASIDRPTGFMYVDIDDTDSIESFMNEYVAAYWRSTSGTGYSVLLSVKGLTKDNTNEVTKYVCNLLNIPYDKNAKSKDRNVILSYDYNAVLLDSYSTIDVSHILKQDLSVHSSLILPKKERGGNTVLNSGSVKLRVNGKDSLISKIDFKDDDIVVDLGHKVGYATVGSSFLKIPEGKRNSSLFFMCCQLKALNTWADIELIKKYMMVINKNGCVVPVSPAELFKICSSVFDRYKRGELKIINNKTCRFLFNPKYNLTNKEKRQIVIKMIRNIRSEEIQKGIEKYIIEHGSINTTHIAKALNISRTTVIKYKKELGY